MIYFRHVTAAVASGLLLTIGSCSNPPAPIAPPKAVPFVAILRIEIIAPPTIEPGATVQLTANAIKADGSIENISSVARWSSANPSIVQVSATGLATGKIRGETRVGASHHGVNSPTPQVFVLPDGTFSLRGSVKDTGFGVDKAQVTVISGVGTGLTMTTGNGGDYVLFGVQGPVQVEARKERYQTNVQQMDVNAHGRLDFEVHAERPRQDYTGTYTLTISAAPCSRLHGVFPEDAKRRVYTASVAQNAGLVTVTLSNADLIVSSGYGNRFFGFADPDGSIVFRIGSGDLYYGDYLGHFDIVERFGETAYMAGGTVVATATPQGISGPLDGTLHISSRATAPFVPSNAECGARTHGFEMVRQ